MRNREKMKALSLAGILALGQVARAGLSTQVDPTDGTAAASPAEEMSIGDMLRKGAERNVDVKAARAEWRAAIEAVPQATALPDPMVRLDIFGENVETRVGPQQYRLGVSQLFPYPGTLAQTGRVVSKEAAIKRAQYDRALRDLIVDLKLSFYELLYLRGAAEITKQNQDLLEHILKITNMRLGEGKAKLNDVLKAQSQVAQLSYDVVMLRELEHVETATINTLLDLPTVSPIGELRPPKTVVRQFPVEQVETAALAHRQEIEIAEAMVEKRREAIRLAELRNRPKFTISAMQIGTGEAAMPVNDSGKDPWLVGVGVSIPLWFDRNRSRVHEATLLYESAENHKRAVENRTRGDVRSVYFRLENARRLVELYEKTLIPQAEEAMEIAEQWHDGDVKDISGFLETQGVWLNFNLARLRALTDYQQYLARLERLVGGSLPPAPHEKEAVQ